MQWFLVLSFLGLASFTYAQALNRDAQRVVDLLSAAVASQTPLVEQALNAQQRSMLPACAPLKNIEAERLSVLNEPRFDLDGFPKAGRWQVAYTVQACGATHTRSVLFTAREEAGLRNGVAEGIGKITFEVLEPGASLTDPALRADVLNSLRASAKQAVPTCGNFPVIDTRVLEQPQHANAKWRELWQVAVCPGQGGRAETPASTPVFTQVVSFYPSPAGTLFRMSLPPAGVSPTRLGR